MAKSVVVKSGGTIYPGRNNSTVFAFYNDASLDTTLVGAITRMGIVIGGVYVDSALYPSLFDWTTGAASAEVTVRLGSLSLAVPSSGASVNVYTPTYPLGYEFSSVPLYVQQPLISESGVVYGVKVAVPASATASGQPGEWAVDTSYFYVYTGDGSTHSWRRASVSAW